MFPGKFRKFMHQSFRQIVIHIRRQFLFLHTHASCAPDFSIMLPLAYKISKQRGLSDVPALFPLLSYSKTEHILPQHLYI